MSLHSFLTFNKNCPICNNELTLYWQWINFPLFKAIEVGPSTYYFAKYKSAEHEFDDEDDRSMTLFDYGTSYKTSFSCPSLLNEVKTHQTYFYFLCNEMGFNSKNLNDYEINLARGCYYRSSPLMEFHKGNDGWELVYVIDEFAGLPYTDESFALRKRRNREDKIYMVNRNLEKQVTKLWFHTITDEQRKDPKFKPLTLRKELPLIDRPSFEDKGKLINRLETWIVMS